ncbi:hypothetical protein ABK040_000256 [Willaertia magna]
MVKYLKTKTSITSMSNHPKTTTSGIHNGADSLENQDSNVNKRKRISERMSVLKESDKNTKKVKGDNNLLLTDNTSKNQILISGAHSDAANNISLNEEEYHDDTPETSLNIETESQQNQSESSDNTNTTHNFPFPGQTKEYDFLKRTLLQKLLKKGKNPMGPFDENDRYIKSLMEWKSIPPKNSNKVYDSMWVRLMKLTKVDETNKCWVLEKTNDKLGVMKSGVTSRVLDENNVIVTKYTSYKKLTYSYLLGEGKVKKNSLHNHESCVEGCYSPFHITTKPLPPKTFLVKERFLYKRKKTEKRYQKKKTKLIIPKEAVKKEYPDMDLKGVVDEVVAAKTEIIETEITKPRVDIVLEIPEKKHNLRKRKNVIL